MIDLKAIRERVEKATAGEWLTDLWYIVAEVPGGRPGGEVIGELRGTSSIARDGRYPEAQRKWDADFIAHARQDIPDLLDAFEEALGILEIYNNPLHTRIQAFLAKHGEGKGK